MTSQDAIVLTGQCHCGSVRAEFHLGRPVSAIQVRACQCGFCRRHGAATAADPSGRLVITSGRPLIRYRFGAGALDMLICAACGVYVAALLEAEGRALATVNVAGLAMAPLDGNAPAPIDYDAEGGASRLQRRLGGWTPVLVSEADG